MEPTVAPNSYTKGYQGVPKVAYKRDKEAPWGFGAMISETPILRRVLFLEASINYTVQKVQFNNDNNDD